MNSKKVKTSLKNKEEKIKEISHFGYTLTSETPKGKNVILSFSKGLNSNDRTLKKLEGEYKIATKSFPTEFFFFGIVAGALIWAYFYFSKNMPLFSLGFLEIGIIFSAIALFLLFGFIFIKLNKKRYLENIFLRADRHTNKVRDLPIKSNLESPSDLSGKIGKNLDKVLKK